MTLQRVTLVGFTGGDPEMRYSSDGTAVTNFSFATSETIPKADRSGAPRPCPKGWVESYNGKNWTTTTWWRVTCWRGLAEMVNQYVSKGMPLYIEGKMNGETADGKTNPRVWQGKDGGWHCSYELTANTVKFMERSGQGGGGAPVGEPPPTSGYDVDEDILPF